MRTSLLDRLLAIGLLAIVVLSALWTIDRYYLDRVEERYEQISALESERAMLARRRYAEDDLETLSQRVKDLNEVASSLEQVENQRLALANAETWLRERVETTDATLMRLQSEATPLVEGGQVIAVTLTARFECPEAGLADMVSRLEFEGRISKPLKSITLRRDDAFGQDDRDPVRMLRGQFEILKLYRVDLVAVDQQ